MEDVSSDAGWGPGPITGTQLLFDPCSYLSCFSHSVYSIRRYTSTEILFKLNQIKFLSEEIF